MSILVLHVVVRKFMNRRLREKRMEIMQSTEKEKVALSKERIDMFLGGKQDSFFLAFRSLRY